MKKALAAAMLAFLAAPSLGADPNYAERPEVREFVREVAARHGFAEEALLAVFSRVERAEPILEAIKPPPPKARSWQEYRGNFVNEQRISGGSNFWKAHRAPLALAEQRYGVPAEYIVAIIGVETFYGRYAGRWRVLDALTTLAFDYPPRSPYFRQELEQYLLLSRDTGADLFDVRGSYAGAIGIPQFMPSSTRRYAVDFDGSGEVDLRRSAADAIGSVANFLKEHGWQAGGPVLLDAHPSGESWRPLADGAVRPKYSPGELRKAGVDFPAVGEEAQVALIELETPDKPSDVRVGLHNFYVLTRYNRSSFYAAAVHDLASAVRKRTNGS